MDLEQDKSEQMFVDKQPKRRQFTGAKHLILEQQETGSESDPLLGKKRRARVSLPDRYRERGRGKAILSPSRHDAFKGDETPDVNKRNY